MPVIRKPAIILLISTLIGCLAVAITATATGGTEATHGGRFYLVSVGCGDADNITLKAMKVLEALDPVIIPGVGYYRCNRRKAGRAFLCPPYLCR